MTVAVTKMYNFMYNELMVFSSFIFSKSSFTWNTLQHYLTHWGRVMYICVSKLTIIGSDNGLSPGRCQAIIWTNAGILLIGTLGTKVSEILITICTFSLKKLLLKMSSGKRRPSCLGLNVLISSMNADCIMTIKPNTSSASSENIPQISHNIETNQDRYH